MKRYAVTFNENASYRVVVEAAPMDDALHKLHEVDAMLSAFLTDTAPDGESWDDHPVDAARTVLHEVIEMLGRRHG